MVHNRTKAAGRRRILFLAAGLLIAFLLSFAIGRYPVPLKEVIRILGKRLLHLPLEATWDAKEEIAMINLRLPRIVLAMVVGGALSGAGCAYQSVFRNPMAAPDILGASSGACFGAALAILFGFSSLGITGMAFLTSLLSLCFVYLVGTRIRGVRTVSLLLAGIMIGSLFSSGTSYIKLVADPTNQLPAITYWLMGSLAGTKMSDLLIVVFPVTAGLLALMLIRWRMNLLTLPSDEARSMGVNAERIRLTAILSATLLTAASVAAAGMIGWVGLVVPNLCRRVFGADNRYLLPGAVLAGALFLLVTDDIARNLMASEIPIGILTALIGAPFFLYLMTQKGR